LGRGAEGCVVRGTYIPTETDVAVKVVTIREKERRDQLVNDVSALLRLCPGHPGVPMAAEIARPAARRNLVQMWGAYSIAASHQVHVVLELMDLGSIAKLLTRLAELKVGVPLDVTANMARQMVEGISFLHLNHQLHRDIKPGNVLVNSDGDVKLTDFGIAKDLGSTQGACDTFVGTPVFMSPERLTGDDYSFPVDIWACGLIVLCLAQGVASPYPASVSSSLVRLCRAVAKDPAPSLDAVPEITEEAKFFVSTTVNKDPNLRPTVLELRSHPFLQTAASTQEFQTWLLSVLDEDESESEEAPVAIAPLPPPPQRDLI